MASAPKRSRRERFWSIGFWKVESSVRKMRHLNRYLVRPVRNFSGRNDRY